MLELFKGQLSMHDIMYGLTLKQGYELRDTRFNRLKEERKAAEAELNRK